jgi:cytochrome P450
LLDARADGSELDVVDDLAYPLPVTVICELLGVPPEDEAHFHGWASALARSLDPAEGIPEPEIEQARQAALQLLGYLAELVEVRRARPGDDLLSALVVGDAPDGRMTPRELLGTIALVLIAGHETTVNLVANGMLALLRHPDALDQLRADSELVVPLIEDVLRYDPPVQFPHPPHPRRRQPGGHHHPERGDRSRAARLRQPRPSPIPGRRLLCARPRRRRPLGFGRGIHYYVGAPLARVEARVALGALARRLVAPRLLADPPYRDNASLRGPAHLRVAFDGMR